MKVEVELHTFLICALDDGVSAWRSCHFILGKYLHVPAGLDAILKIRYKSDHSCPACSQSLYDTDTDIMTINRLVSYFNIIYLVFLLMLFYNGPFLIIDFEVVFKIMRLKFKCIIGKSVLEAGGRWNWFRIMPSGGFYYYRLSIV
jgi:hypothetical protein